MRTSSVKTAISMLFLVLTLVAVTPTASAGPTRPRDTAPIVQNEPRGIERIARAARRFLNRLTGGISTNSWPLPPIPAPTPNP